MDPSEIPSVPPSSRKPDREGLPSSYKMRADAHYVDQLTTRRSEPPLADAPRTPKRGGDPVVREAREVRDGRGEQQVLAQLLEEIGTINASAAMLAGDASALSRRANVDALRAHAWRAAWLLRAHALVDGAHHGQIKVRQVGALLAQVRDGFAPECRLAGLTMQVTAADWHAGVAIDETALVTGITGAVLATLAFLPDPSGSVLAISATTLANELRALEVSQDEVAIPPAVSSVFFDPSWPERPGGWLAALGAASLKAAAQLHGGDVVFMAGARRGSTIRLNVHRVS